MAPSKPARPGSVLCCHIPDLPLKLAYRAQPVLQERPLALYSADERICAVSPLALHSGVCKEMWNRQAQMRCPDLVLHPLDMEACRQEQDAFMGTLRELDLPVETQSWGSAYVDLHTVTHGTKEVQAIATDVGRRLRTELGDELQPVLGWDSGKFTARAAALSTQPGCMRLVDKADEVRFLSPLSISLLPLSQPSLQYLHWLGIRQLGQYAALPRTAIWQRFGAAGAMAQRWAMGNDDRPVRNTLPSLAETLEIDLDPPTALLHLVLDALVEALRTKVQTMAETLEGCRGLHLTLSFIEGSQRTLEIHFMEPVSQLERIQTTLSNRLHTLNWPAELVHVSLAVETAELTAGQLSFFPELETESPPLHMLAQKLIPRFGPLFSQAVYVDRDHPLAERRLYFEVLA